MMGIVYLTLDHRSTTYSPSGVQFWARSSNLSWMISLRYQLAISSDFDHSVAVTAHMKDSSAVDYSYVSILGNA